MSAAATNNEEGTVRGPNNVYADPSPETSIYDEDPGHLQEAPWQRHLDTRYGVLTRSFTNARGAAEVDRRTVGGLFDHKGESHSALLSMPAASVTKKTAAPATLAERVRQLTGRM